MLTHHAYLVHASSIETAHIPEHYKTQTADITHIVVDRFSIEQARKLTELAQGQAFEVRGMRVFVIAAQDIAIEAQNALLKLFEEPPQGVVFYLVLPKTSFVAATLLSRLCVVQVELAGVDADTNDTFASFVSASYAERLATIADKTKEKDYLWIEQIVTGAEHVAIASKKVVLLQTIVLIQTHIRTKGASAKMLLEELALLLPQS